MNVLCEWNGSKNSVDVEDGDTVFAIDDEAKGFDAFHDLRERLQGLNEGLGPAVSVHRKHADDLRMDGKVRRVVSANRVDVLLDHGCDLISHATSRSTAQGRRIVKVPAGERGFMLAGV